MNYDMFAGLVPESRWSRQSLWVKGLIFGFLYGLLRWLLTYLGGVESMFLANVINLWFVAEDLILAVPGFSPDLKGLYLGWGWLYGPLLYGILGGVLGKLYSVIRSCR